MDDRLVNQTRDESLIRCGGPHPVGAFRHPTREKEIAMEGSGYLEKHERPDGRSEDKE